MDINQYIYLWCVYILYMVFTWLGRDHPFQFSKMYVILSKILEV